MRYWIGVASRDHVILGVAGGFCQLCHGKAQPLKRMDVNDWLIYYSPKTLFHDEILCQKFTAIGQIVGGSVFSFEMSPTFIPYRREVNFLKAVEVPIRPLLDKLSFIQDKSKWGYVFRFGFLEIPQADFALIAESMLVEQDTQIFENM
jgi:hypothetical protein